VPAVGRLPRRTGASPLKIWSASAMAAQTSLRQTRRPMPRRARAAARMHPPSRQLVWRPSCKGAAGPKNAPRRGTPAAAAPYAWRARACVAGDQAAGGEHARRRRRGAARGQQTSRR
jgi:hypothetical protein